MDDFLQDTLKADTQLAIASQRDASGNFLSMLDRKFLQLYSEVDPTQASAIKSIQRGRAPAPSSE